MGHAVYRQYFYFYAYLNTIQLSCQKSFPRGKLFAMLFKEGYHEAMYKNSCEICLCD